MADQGLRLSEHRRCEFEQDPASAEHRRLPRATRGVALSLVTFLSSEAKESYCAAGRTPGIGATTESAH